MHKSKQSNNCSPTIETYTGKMFNILNPTLDMIDIRDIAHAGSLLCRFTGHTKFHYSVAQHELIGSWQVPLEYALEFLLHDAAESYINDMSRPLKHMTKCGDAYRPIEERVQVLIRQTFGLPKVQSPLIHLFDNKMLMTEKKQLMSRGVWSPEEMAVCKIDTTDTFDIIIAELTPREVERNFLTRFIRLTGERNNANHQLAVQNNHVRQVWQDYHI